MAKRFFYLSAGMLCLMLVALIGFHIGGQSVQAQDGGGIFASFGATVLDVNGEVWEFKTSPPISCWTRGAIADDPPIPLSEIRMWNYRTIVSTNNEVWVGDGNTWQNCGPWPGTVPTNQSTWGATKEQFKPND